MGTAQPRWSNRGLDKGVSPEYAEYLDSALNDIMGQIGDYKGFAVALDEPMAVLCRYVCMLRSEEGVVSDAWRERIEAIDEGRYAIEFSGGYDAQVLRIRVRALRAAAGLGDGIDYLADGFILGSCSELAAGAYLESLGWLIASLVIPDEFAPLVRKITKTQRHLWVRAQESKLHVAWLLVTGAGGLRRLQTPSWLLRGTVTIWLSMMCFAFARRTRSVTRGSRTE